jgi:solute carrier family 25 (mitochondrial phosphate transporter), member 23/24/25/41
MSPGMGGYSSIGGAVRKMIAEEGIRGFYKGLYPNLLKVPTLLYSSRSSRFLLLLLNAVC